MKTPIFHLSLLAALVAPLRAEDPLLTGLRSAFIACAPVPQKSSGMARSVAAELLARYVKSDDGSSFTVQTIGSPAMRIEMNGLRLTRVTKTALSQVDRANGVTDRYFVIVECQRYRTFDDKTASWSEWSQGKAPVMPSVVYVGRHADGQWHAASPELPSLSEFHSSGNPDLVLSDGPP